MSSITFDATLNKEKLDAAIRESNQTIKQWSDGVEKAGGKAGQSFSKVGISLKDSIRDQKEYIKGLTKEIKDMEKAFDSATAGKGKQAAGNELIQAKRRLSEATGELVGMQNEQIAVNQREAESANGIIGKLKGWALGLVTVGAALKVAKSIIASTEETAHKFEQVVAGATAGVGYFFKSIASGDWSNFFQGMDRAIRGAVEFVDAMERIQNKQNEQKIKSAKIDKDIAELRDQTYDKDESNNKARQEALEKIIIKQKEKYDAEAKLAKDLYDTNLRKASTDSGLAADRIENFIKEYSSLEKLIEIGTRYNEITNLTRKAGMDPGYVANLLKERNALGANAAAAGQYVKQISKVVPEARKQLSDFSAAAIEAEAAFGSRNRRDKMQLAEVTNKIKQEQEDARKAAIEAAKIENQIKAQQDLLNKAIEEGNQAEIKAIGERIRKLQEELALRERIARAAIAATMTREAPIQKLIDFNIPTFGTYKPPMLAGAPVTQKESNYIPGTAMLSEQGLANQKKKSAKEDKDAEESLKRQLELRKQIFDSVAGLISQLGEQLGFDEKSMATLNAGLDSFSKLATGDLVGGATAMLSAIISQIPSSASKFEAQIEHINQLLEKQQRLIDQSERTGGESQALQGQIDLLEQQRDLLEARIAKDQKKMNSWIDLFGSKQRAEADMYQALDALDKINIQLADAELQLSDFLAGGINETNIADAIQQGFADGLISAEDFANTFNQFMLDAINNAIKDMSKPQISEWYKKFAADMASEGGLSEAEKASLKEDWDKIINDTAAMREEAYKLAGVSAAGDIGKPGLVGAITREITEATGTELVGIIRGQKDDIRVIRDFTKLGIDHMMRISENTYGTWQELLKANIKLDSVITNTKPVYAADLGGG